MSEAVVCVFTVYFDDPFWVGVSERVYDGKLETAKVVFGAEPTEPEIQNFLLYRWDDLRYSPPVELDGELVPASGNPKRTQRAARKQMTRTIGTKSQQALQDQRTEAAQARKQRRRQDQLEEERQRFLERQEKKKQKKRGH